MSRPTSAHLLDCRLLEQRDERVGSWNVNVDLMGTNQDTQVKVDDPSVSSSFRATIRRCMEENLTCLYVSL